MIDDKLESDISAYLREVADRSPQLSAHPAPNIRRSRKRAMPVLAAAAVVLVIGAGFGLRAVVSSIGTPGPTSGASGETLGQPALPPAGQTTALTADQLVGRWEPSQLQGQPVLPEPVWESMPWIEFSAEGTFSAWDGCNNARGTYTFKQPSSLTFDSMRSKFLGCSNFPHPYEATRTARLSEGGLLTMMDAADNSLVVYRRS